MDRSLPDTQSGSDDVLRHLAEDNDTAAAALFLDLCRTSPVLRSWLWGRFAKSETIRTELARVLDSSQPVADPLALFSTLSGEPVTGADREIAALQRDLPAKVHAPRYGGLTRREVETLIRRYQAGHIDTASFLFVYAWRRHLQSGATQPPPTLLRASNSYLATMISEGRVDLAKELSKALIFLSDKKVGEIGKSDFGYAHWWKLCVLHYMLNHPKARYCTGELHDYLKSQGVIIDPKEIRVFCKTHGIQRDTRAGRRRSATAKS
ncbi:hypothetical protein Ga0100231_019090 [Opitutaceae bacterium TAV4]|nr:hypothetical protein Ga0100231_019090 [Opitutaceae bacterium TAV4]RRK00201.1 hypothetical protein Ga0100230_019765 [Opitutaceae bacterium TAV3]RRK01988.1 hypothetical protein Ga0100230_001875 [Opitutaceae bacterium TAV3]